MDANLLRNDHHDFGPTEKELAHILDYITNVSFHLVMRDAYTPGTASLEEYQDRGVEALVYAWQVWDGQRGIPFHAFTKHVCWLRMRQATSKYQAWAFPCGGRSLPDAERLGRIVAQDSLEDGTGGTRELVCDPPESLAWFSRDIARHWDCMSPRMQQTLKDTLADLPREAIAARDHVTSQTVYERFTTLVAFLRRHVYDRMTSCQEEVQTWKIGTSQKRIDPAEQARKAQARMQRWRAANRERLAASQQARRQARIRSRHLAAVD
jgi:hypothetical protein